MREHELAQPVQSNQTSVDFKNSVDLPNTKIDLSKKWSLASTYLVKVLEGYLADSKDPSKKLQFLARKTEINAKTLKRILNQQNEPSFATITRVLKFIYQCSANSDLLAKIPADVAAELKKNYGHRLGNEQQISAADSIIFKKNPIALEIYLRVVAQTFDKKKFRERFGSYGEEILNKLCAMEFIIEAEPGVFKMGGKSLEFSPELVIQSGAVCLENFVDFESGFEKGKHYASFYLEHLSPEGYLKWIEIQKSSVRAQVEILKNPEYLGKIPTFSFSIIDSVKI